MVIGYVRRRVEQGQQVEKIDDKLEVGVQKGVSFSS